MALCCAACIALAACAGPSGESPVIVSGLSYAAGEKADAFRFAGITFSAYNCTDKDIASISLSCRLYDADKKPVAVQGSNECAASFDGILAARQSRDLCINLDSMIGASPKKNILIDFFRISSVSFADGSVWKNTMLPEYARSYP